MSNALEIVKSFYKSYEDEDLEGFLRLCDPNIEWVINGPTSLEHCLTFKGISGVKNFLEILDRTCVLQSFKQNRFFVDDSAVIVLGEEIGKDINSSESFKGRWVHIFDIKHKKIVRFKEFLCRWNEEESPPEMMW